jgi:hypothetical protein
MRKVNTNRLREAMKKTKYISGLRGFVLMHENVIKQIEFALDELDNMRAVYYTKDEVVQLLDAGQLNHLGTEMNHIKNHIDKGVERNEE